MFSGQCQIKDARFVKHDNSVNRYIELRMGWECKRDNNSMKGQKNCHKPPMGLQHSGIPAPRGRDSAGPKTKCVLVHLKWASHINEIIKQRTTSQFLICQLHT